MHIGEGRRGASTIQPKNRREVKEWVLQNWGKFDSEIIKDSRTSKLPSKLSLDGGYGRGKVGLLEKVDAILKRKTKETPNGLKWLY